MAVGNKNDDPSLKYVLTQDAQQYANAMRMPLFETSAKENVNVDEMFDAITRMVLRTKKEAIHNKKNENESSGIKVGKSLTSGGGSKIKKKCC